MVKKNAKIFLFAFFIILYYVYNSHPDVKYFYQSGIALLRDFDALGLRSFLLSYGHAAFVGSISLVIAQSLIPFLPGMALTIANAWLFGWQWGAVCTWIGALIGALADFILARVYGRQFVERFFSISLLNSINNYMERHGIAGIIASRIIPVIPFKIVSYSCGFSRISYVRFTAATALGQTPGIIAFSILGERCLTDWRSLLLLTGIFIASGVLFYISRKNLYHLTIYKWLKSF